MQNFVSQSKDDELKRVYSEKSMWTEVQEEAAKAVDEYNRQGHSWRHPFRTAGRAFTDTASAAEFLIELLPNGDYASVLCGALRLVYNARSQTFDTSWRDELRSVAGCHTNEAYSRTHTKMFSKYFTDDR